MKSDKLQHSEGSGVHKRNESQKVEREKEKWHSLKG
jgi:hypothetical protein